ncbi:YPDG domain-containing protein [Mammaliicoccus sciuri]|nr:YPDG domain-containing protein [Mammaliicoccus sciuri]
MKPGIEIKIPQTGDNHLPAGTTFEIPENGLPIGWTVNFDETGNATVTPPVNETLGKTVSIPVTVNYPDGSVDDTSIPVKVIPNQAQEHTPNYNKSNYMKPSQKIDIPQTGDKDLPNGTTFEITKNIMIPEGYTVAVDPNSGTVTITAPSRDIIFAEINMPITVKYPDGSSEEIHAIAYVLPKDLLLVLTLVLIVIPIQALTLILVLILTQTAVLIANLIKILVQTLTVVLTLVLIVLLI